MHSFKGEKVLITGAARGIGYCTAKEFSKAGCELVLADIRREPLEAVAEKFRSKGTKVHTYVYDVADQQVVETIARRVLEEVGDLDILINNAGIGYSGELAETPLRTWKKLVDVNLWGPLYHIYAFLPAMKARNKGHIVNISSGQAFFRLPTWGAYAAIKLALGAFSEVLHFELRKYNIKVTTVYPFLVNTPFYEGIEGDTVLARLSMRLLPLYSMSPSTVGKIIFRAVKREQRVEMVSFLNEIGRYLRVFAPEFVAALGNLVLSRRPGGREKPKEPVQQLAPQ